MGQIVGAVRGMGRAAQALDYPVVSGNVSLYNETEGKAILPTPVIGGVGLLEDGTQAVGIALHRAGLELLLVGETAGWIGRSLWLAEAHGLEAGAPPPVDLQMERRHGDFVRQAIRDGLVAACHDVADGGLLVAVAEMALAGRIGAALDVPPTAVPVPAWCFGEDQARYVLAVDKADTADLAARAKAGGVPLARIGTSGGDLLTLAGHDTISLAELGQAHDSWLPGYMARG
jgi:phosphoribosylformylglycinamidine synthase